MLVSCANGKFTRLANVIVDGIKIDFNKQETSLELFSKNNIQIPHKCQGAGDCGLCKILVNGKVRSACDTTVTDGMIISTKDSKIKQRIENKVRLMSVFDKDVEKAYQTIKNPKMKQNYIDKTTGSIQLDHNKCIDCMKCVDVCPTHALIKSNDHLQTFGYFGLKYAGCVGCGKCLSVCPTAALSVSDNIPLFKSAMKVKNTMKVAVLDLSIIENIEKELGVEMNLEKLLILLGNVGFDYLLDSSLISDYRIIKDASKIINHHTYFYQRTFGTFCPTFERKYIEYVLTPEKKIIEYLTNPGLDITTFVVTDFLSKRSEATFFIDKLYFSVGVSTNEFLKIMKEEKPSLTGNPCKMFPLGSQQAAEATTSEKFSNAVISTFVKNFTTAKPPNLVYRQVDDGIKIAEFHIGENTTAQAAIVETTADVERLLNMKMPNLIYISPNEKVNQKKFDYHRIQRDYKLSAENPSAKKLWSKYLEEVDHELAMKRKCTV